MTNTDPIHTPIPLDTFLADNALTMGVTQIPERTDEANVDHVYKTPHKPTHWLVTLRCLPMRTSFSFQFTQGSGHKGQPSLRTLVDCAISDASAFEAARDAKLPAITPTTASEEFAFETQFAAFCSELGYDVDSRTAERAFRGCVRMWHGLQSILSERAFRQAMDGDVEGL